MSKSVQKWVGKTIVLHTRGEGLQAVRVVSVEHEPDAPPENCYWFWAQSLQQPA